MAATRRNPNASVEQQLRKTPYRFSFFQAVRLLELSGRQRKTGGYEREVGYDHPPDRECVHFTGHPSHSFPPSEIVSLHFADSEGLDAAPTNADQVPEMCVAFMGMYGPSGVLPHHDTQRIVDAGRQKNVEKDLLDIFNHRVLSLFFRAWAKYRIPLAFERTYASEPSGPSSKSLDARDIFTTAYLSIAGLGTDGLAGQQEVPDEFAIEFAGLLSQKPKNASALKRIIEEYFSVACKVNQFVGQWLQLGAENRSEMPTRVNTLGQNCQLGSSFVVGDRIWDLQSKFSLLLGPVRYAEFQELMPGQPRLTQIAQVVRTYVGVQFDFDIQVELLAEEIPSTSLSGSARLGQNAWLLSSPAVRNSTDAVFSHSGYPIK